MHQTVRAKHPGSAVVTDLELGSVNPADLDCGTTAGPGGRLAVIAISDEHITPVIRELARAPQKRDLCAKVGGSAAIPLEDDSARSLIGRRNVSEDLVLADVAYEKSPEAGDAKQSGPEEDASDGETTPGPSLHRVRGVRITPLFNCRRSSQKRAIARFAVALEAPET